MRRAISATRADEEVIDAVPICIVRTLDRKAQAVVFVDAVDDDTRAAGFGDLPGRVGQAIAGVHARRRRARPADEAAKPKARVGSAPSANRVGQRTFGFCL